MKRKISYDKLYDKVLGGWIGKSLGGIVGAPVECHRVLGDFTADNCWPSKLYPNDDLDIQVVWLELLEEQGTRLTSEEMAAFWQERCWYNFSEYGFFLYNRQRGVQPPLSGAFDNWFCLECMGCPIRSEIWGMFAAGNTALAAKMARYDGQLDHTGASVDAERFFAAAEAEAFFSDDLETCLKAGLSVLPAGSILREIYADTQALWEKCGTIEGAHLPLVRKYGHRDYSKVEINFAFTLLSLFAGKGDMKATIVAAINCGWDSDCTAATAGAFLGILRGAKACPADWVEKMGDRLDCDVNVRHKNALLSEFAADTCLVIAEGALTVNRQIEIEGMPEAVAKEARRRANIRPARAKVTLSAEYTEGMMLIPGEEVCFTVRIENRGDAFEAELCAQADEGMEVRFPARIRVPHGKSEADFACIYRGERLRDKNLIRVRLQGEGQEAALTVGLVGARPWLVYGPYFDIYDREKFDKNPYRNEEIISHPNNVPGNFEVMVHNFVYQDRAYLDEEALLKGELPEERPYLVYTEENRLQNGALGGFVGECCYYIVREVVSPVDHDCLAVFSCSSPLTVWADGEKVYEKTGESTCGLLDIRIPVSLKAGVPMRFVCKTPSRTDARELCMFFVEHFTTDKSRGVSFALDSLSFDLPEIETEEVKKWRFRK